MGGSRSGGARYRRVTGLLLALGVALLGTACTPDGEAPAQQREAGPVVVGVAVYGTPEVIDAYRRIAADFSAVHRAIAVRVRAYADHDSALAAVRRSIRAGHGPSLFLADRGDLDALVRGRLTMPVDELLGERRVDFGDGYARTALEAFSRDAALQCMPTQLSPLVVYYNKRLVDLAAARGADGAPITADDGWTFAQFARAARRTARTGHAGVWIAPTLEQLAPFIASAGGGVVDDDEHPTAVTLSGASAVEALRAVRHLLAQPGVAPAGVALRRRGPLATFERGGLGMLFGYRDLTPELRRHRGLAFDVLPLPVLGTPATVGRVEGMCLTRTRSTTVSDAAADFLAYLVSDGPAAVLARTGSVLPTNLGVDASPAFLQPGRQPSAARVFPAQVRRIALLPTGRRWDRASAVVDRGLAAILGDPRTGDLAARLAVIDAAASAVLAPPAPTSTPTATPTASSAASTGPDPGTSGTSADG